MTSNAPLPRYWEVFLSRAKLPQLEIATPDRALLDKITAVFAMVPYENATLISGGREHLRLPEILIEDYVWKSTGGTSYDLAFALFDLLRRYRFDASLHRGWTAENDALPAKDRFADHAAVTVRLGGEILLCDPGMLFRGPAPIGSSFSLQTGVREAPVLINADGLIARSALHRPSGTTTLARIDLHALSRDAFFRQWSESQAQMLARPALRLKRATATQHFDLHDRTLAIADARGDELVKDVGWQEIAATFRVPVVMVIRAWRLTPYASIEHRVLRRVKRLLRSA